MAIPNYNLIQKIALKTIRRILEKEFTLEDAFEKDERIDSLKPADKKFLQESVMTVLFRRGEILKFLSGFTKEADYSLELGVAQIVLLKHPRAELINELVDLAEKKQEKAHYRAVLNRLDHKEFHNDPGLNYPNWMKGSWKKAYGEEKTKQIMASMSRPINIVPPEFPEANEVIEAPSSETGLIGGCPELLYQRQLEDVQEFVKLQNEAVEEAYSKLKKGKTALYYNFSLQYEEGEGFLRKLDKNKWELVEQKRVLPCDSGSGGIGWFQAKLKRI